MVLVDLHLHTTASDGRLSPTKLVELVASRGLQIVAITDHDSTEGLDEAFQAGERFPDLTVIPGIELSTDLPGREVHVLGYFIDYRSPELQKVLYSSRQAREKRGRLMVKKLSRLGIDISWSRVRELAQGAVGRPHVAQALVEKGYIQYPREAFESYIGRDGPAYVPTPKIAPQAAIELILHHHGLPVLAHPREMGGVDQVVPSLAEVGLQGIEIYYKDYTPEEISHLLRLAKSHDLIPCGGTDYHALGEPGEPIPGSVGPPLDSARRLINLARKRGSPVVI